MLDPDPDKMNTDPKHWFWRNFPEFHFLAQIFISRKTSKHFPLRDNSIFCKNSKFLKAAAPSCSFLAHFFAKIYAITNIFAKIWQNLMSSKYLHKNGPVV
jgi:hypothetical protein